MVHKDCEMDDPDIFSDDLDDCSELPPPMIGFPSIRVVHTPQPDTFMELYRSGASTRKIAKKLGISLRKAQLCMRQKGLRPNNRYKHLTASQIVELIRMHNRGCLNAEIARKIGCHPTSVRNVLERCGLKPNVWNREE